MKIITKGGRKLEPENLAEAEARIGHAFPTDYRQFLLDFNGGTPILPLFNVGSRAQAIHSFMHIGVGGADDLFFVRNALSDTLDTERVVPIARTVLGDMVCLDLSDGRVLFWLHDQPPNVSGLDELKPIAKNFTAFADILYAEESREVLDSLHKLGKSGGAKDFAEIFATGCDLTTEDGYSLGEVAAMHGNIDLFKAWLAARMPVGRALHIASKNGRFPIVDHLVGIGVDINSLDVHGKTPLDVASWDDDYKKELRHRGAKTSAEANRGRAANL